MAKPLSLAVTIPTNIAATAEIVERGGIYFGTKWTFTATDQAGDHMLFEAVNAMLADYSVSDIAETLFALRGGDRG